MDKDGSGDISLGELKMGIKDFGLRLTSVSTMHGYFHIPQFDFCVISFLIVKQSIKCSSEHSFDRYPVTETPFGCTLRPGQHV